MNKRTLVGGLAAAGLVGIGIALAQVQPIPKVVSVGTADLFQDIVGGFGQAQSFYATAAQITHVPGYVKVVPLTAFSLTFANGQTNMILNPAGTLATGTITTEPNPADGARECISSTQTQTALTITANTGQTINNTATALVANVPVCFTFSSGTGAWDRGP
jgi:hypothetical protein